MSGSVCLAPTNDRHDADRLIRFAVLSRIEILHILLEHSYDSQRKRERGAQPRWGTAPTAAYPAVYSALVGGASRGRNVSRRPAPCPPPRRDKQATPADVPAHEPASSRKRSPSRAAICCGQSARTRAATSSNASGRPSSARQIRSTGPRSPLHAELSPSALKVVRSQIPGLESLRDG
jgi:hypothetical protein